MSSKQENLETDNTQLGDIALTDTSAAKKVSTKSSATEPVSEVIEREDRYDHKGITEKLRERVRRREKGQQYLKNVSQIEVDKNAKIKKTLETLKKDPEFKKLSFKEKQEREKIETEKVEEEAKDQLKEQMGGLGDDFTAEELEDLGLDTDGAFDNPFSDLAGDDSTAGGSTCRTLICWTLCCPCSCGYCCCQYTCCLGPTIIWRSLCCPFRILRKFKKTNVRSKDMPPDGNCLDKCERSRIILDDCAFWRGTQTQALFQPTANVPNFTKGEYAAQAREFEYPMVRYLIFTF